MLHHIITRATDECANVTVGREQCWAQGGQSSYRTAHLGLLPTSSTAGIQLHRLAIAGVPCTRQPWCVLVDNPGHEPAGLQSLCRLLGGGEKPGWLQTGSGWVGVRSSRQSLTSLAAGFEAAVK
eukprot:g76844.t1